MQKQRELQGSFSRPQNLRLLNVFKVPEDPNGIASLTLSVRVTVDIFENPRGSEGYEDRDPDPHDPSSC